MLSILKKPVSFSIFYEHIYHHIQTIPFSRSFFQITEYCFVSNDLTLHLFIFLSHNLSGMVHFSYMYF